MEGPDLSWLEDLGERRTDRCSSRGCAGTGSGWGEEVGLRGGEDPQEEGASGQLPQVSCQKSKHKKAGGEQQGEEGEKRWGGTRGGGEQPLHTKAWQGGVSNTWCSQRE